jgi:L-2-hydroxyglutarate oxidase LhgO
VGRQLTIESDVVIAGTGIIGLAVAKSLLAQEPRLKVLVVEKEQILGEHTAPFFGRPPQE